MKERKKGRKLEKNRIVVTFETLTDRREGGREGGREGERVGRREGRTHGRLVLPKFA